MAQQKNVQVTSTKVGNNLGLVIYGGGGGGRTPLPKFKFLAKFPMRVYMCFYKYR